VNSEVSRHEHQH